MRMSGQIYRYSLRGFPVKLKLLLHKDNVWDTIVLETKGYCDYAGGELFQIHDDNLERFGVLDTTYMLKELIKEKL